MATAAKTSDSANGATKGASISDIEAELARLREDISGLAGTLQSYGAAKGSEIKGKAAKTGSDVTAASQDALELVRNEFLDLERQIRGRVRRHPLQALGIAAGVGFLAALMARR
ncbi:DUF883 C-terminal domain-containing protein [Breoghania sp.]|uniref:DUF883 family protein n=1 Tax=Breoghania sp. TaxID=2065378 RepID=UPI002AABDB94|nr:DUF883 C-terminal domain-containing protein [Breoghania sp.]